MKTKELIYLLYETSIKEIESIRNLAILNGLLNEQLTLDWLDKLNALSLDPEQ